MRVFRLVIALFLLIFPALIQRSSIADMIDGNVDWVVATVTAGPEGASGSRVSILTESYPLGPVLGFGIANDLYWDIVVGGNGDDSTRFRTTESLAGMDVQVLPSQPPHPGSSGIVVTGNLRPNHTYRALFFSADVQFDAEVAWQHQTGTMTVQVRSGIGATAIRFSDADGIGAEIGTNAAGDFSATGTTPAAIVGSFTESSIEHLDGSWTDPSGYGRTYERTAYPSSLSPTWSPVNFEARFWGNAGEWRWTWRGARAEISTGATAVLAYAPIGLDAIPSRTILGPNACGGASIAQPAQCTLAYAGGDIVVAGEAFFSLVGAISVTLKAPDGSDVASCAANGLEPEAFGKGWINCILERGSVGVPTGAELTCEATGRLKFHFHCITLAP